MTKNKRNKVIALTTAVLLIVALAAMGTIAWLTATDSVDNTFTVGKFNKPDTTDPDGSDVPGPVVPGDEKNPDSDDDYYLGGYIFEPSWNKNAEHKILPKATFYKDPYVGIGEGSEEAAVYVYVENPFEEQSVYFRKCDTWTYVDYGETFEKDGVTYFTGGLFKYDETLKLEENKKNAWTKDPVFKQIIVADDVDSANLPVTPVTDTDGTVINKNDITVHAFLHQVYEADGTTEISSNDMLAAAKEAFSLTD